MRALVALFAAVLILGSVQAVSIKWTGYANNNQWTTTTNWYPDQIPGPNDDVTIETGSVFVTVATGVQSLTMGTSFSGVANLTIFDDFFIGNGNAYVSDNGNFIVSTPFTQSVTGVINVDGNFIMTNGVLSGQVTVTSKGSADLSSQGEKVLSGCNFVAQGPIALGGIISMNSSSVFTISGAATVSGLSPAVQVSDSSSVLFDVSSGSLVYNGPGTFGIQAPANFGTLTLSNGNLTIYNNVNFGKSVNIPAGVVIATEGTAVVNISNGITGAGSINPQGASIILGGVNMTGSLNIVSGNVTFASATSQLGSLTIAGGNTFLTSTIVTNNLRLMSGIITGASTLRAAHTTLKANGLVLDAKITFINDVTVSGKAQVTFKTRGTLWARSECTTTIPAGASLGLTGQLGAVGYTNDGAVVVAGSFTTQNINVNGVGYFNVSSTLKVNSASFSTNAVKLSGSGSFQGANSGLSVAAITGSPAVKATIGSYSLSCPSACNNIKTSTTPTSNFLFKL